MQDPPRPPANRIKAWALRKRLGRLAPRLPSPVLVVLTRDTRACIFWNRHRNGSRRGHYHHATATHGSLGRTRSHLPSLEATGIAGWAIRRVGCSPANDLGGEDALFCVEGEGYRCMPRSVMGHPQISLSVPIASDMH